MNLTESYFDVVDALGEPFGEEKFAATVHHRTVSEMLRLMGDQTQYDQIDCSELSANHEKYVRCFLLGLPLPRIVEHFDNQTCKYSILAGLDVLKTIYHTERTETRSRLLVRFHKAELEVVTFDRPYMNQKKIAVAMEAMGY